MIMKMIKVNVYNSRVILFGLKNIFYLIHLFTQKRNQENSTVPLATLFNMQYFSWFSRASLGNLVLYCIKM